MRLKISLFFLLFTFSLLAQSPKEESPDIISIIGVGDIMLGTNYPNKSYLPPDNRNIMLPVKDILLNADVTFGNLEGVLLTGSGDVKKCNNPKYCYAFKSPDEYAAYFKETGFDVVSLANNHANDFGKPGVTNTIKLLEEQEIEYAGLMAYPSAKFVKNGIKYGFAAFAPNTNTVKLYHLENARKIVKELDAECDIVIVSFHGGAEGEEHRHITRDDELYLGERRGNPFLFAKTVIDAGADIVFGHGPHVTRAVNLYKNRFISYSLGNFATYGRFSLNGSKGVAPIIKVFTDKNGEFQKAEVYSIKQVGNGGPVLDPSNKALKEIQFLTGKDIPEAPIIIGDDGIISKRGIVEIRKNKMGIIPR